LLQLFADQQEFVEIIGQDGAKRLSAWDKTSIAGEFVFDVLPDSSAQPDAAAELQKHIKTYELLARDPQVNRVELLRKIAEEAGYDPTRLIVSQPPPHGPEPAKIAFTIKGEDLDIGRPEFPIVLAVLRQSGYQIPDELIAQAQQHKQMQSAVMAYSGIGDPQ